MKLSNIVILDQNLTSIFPTLKMHVVLGCPDKWLLTV